MAMLPRHFDHQDGILSRKGDEHDQADLHIEIVGDTRHAQGGDRAEEGQRDGEDHGQGQDPAFILAGQKQVDQDDGQAEHQDSGGACQFFLIGERGPLILHALREQAERHCLHRLERVARAVAPAFGTDDGGCRKKIVELDDARAVGRRDGDERTERNHTPARIDDGVFFDRIGIHAKRGVRLSVDIERAAELGELIDVGRPEIGLQRVEHLADRDTVGLSLAAVQLEGELGNVGPERSEGRLDRGPPIGLRDDLLRDAVEFVIVERAVGQLDLHLEAVGNAQAGDGGRQHDQAVRLLDLGRGPDDAFMNGRDITILPALLERLEHGIDHAGVEERGTAVDRRRSASADDDGLRHSGHLADGRGQGFHGGTRAVERGGIGELDSHDDVALILARQEAGRGPRQTDQGEADQPESQKGHQAAAPDHAADERHIPLLDKVVDAVEAAEKDVFHAMRVRRPQPQRALCRLERHRIDPADQRGDRDDQCKLTIHLADDARQESGRQEDRHEDKRHGDDGPEKLLHGRDGGLLRRFAELQMLGRSLDHHDGIIDHDADGENDGEKGERVDAESHRRHAGEGADDRDRNRGGGNKGGAPVLQEDHDDEKNEQARLDERLEDLVDGLFDEDGVVERDGIGNALGEGAGEFLHLGPHLFRGVQSVGSRPLVNRHAARRPVVVLRELRVGHRPELHPGYVPQPRDLSAVVRRGFHDDALELLDRVELAVGIDRKLEGLHPRRGRTSHLACSDLRVLIGQG